MRTNRGGGDIHSVFQEIVSIENLFAAWRKLRNGKTNKRDIQLFELSLEDEIFALHEDLCSGSYEHGTYTSFYVCDPKRRHIHKPSVRDRLLHHAIFRVIEPVFDKSFIFDVWSCRTGKGTHAAIERFQRLAWKLSRNNTRTVWVFKLDIRKFFEEVNQERLIKILEGKIRDVQTMDLLRKIIGSFPKGIPLGNLTSQLFANIYLNPFDQFMKHQLRVRHYLRYCDDMLLFDIRQDYLSELLPKIQRFLLEELSLTLHPKKISLTKYHQGIDVLGYICYPHYRILRVKTQKRIFRRISKKNRSSYFGLLRHARSYGVRKKLKEMLKD